MSENGTKAKLYFGGLPTDPQVRKLSEHFGDIPSMRGKIIPHQEIEAIIGEQRGTLRYRTVTDAWRRKVEKGTGIVLLARGEAQGLGFKVPQDGEQVEFAQGEMNSAGRKGRRAYVRAANTDADKLNSDQKRMRDAVMLAGGKMQLALVDARKSLKAPKAIEGSPAGAAA